MAYFRVCRYCGGNLDPGEQCTCQQEKQTAEDFYHSITSIDEDGQYTFDLGAEDEESV